MTVNGHPHVRPNTSEGDEELNLFFEWIKEHFLNTLPLTIMGYLLLILSAAILKTNSLEVVAGVGKTGIYVLCLGCCYVIGKGTHFLINAGLSRITHEKEATA